jgi:hypothetical protein
VQTQS